MGMPEVEYSAFLRYKEMKDKYDYMQGFNCSTPVEIARTRVGPVGFGMAKQGERFHAGFPGMIGTGSTCAETPPAMLCKA